MSWVILPQLAGIRIPGLLTASVVLLLSLTSCSTKSGDAVVLDKEYIAAAEHTPTPSESTPTPTPSSSPADEEAATPRPLGPNEIEVDGVVMDKAVRGTSKDPRAMSDPQWIVRVSLTSNRLRINVHAEQGQFEKLQPGDRVQVTYREGKYTGTVWSSRID